VAASELTVPRFTPVDFTDFVSTRLAESRWAVQDIWPLGALGIISGRPKDGKSTLALELAISLWSGTPMFGLDRFPVLVPPAGVLYLQEENTENRVQADGQRIMEARGLGTIMHYPVFGGPDGSSFLEEVSEFYPRPDAWEEGYEPPPFTIESLSGFNLQSPEDVTWLGNYVHREGMEYVFLDPFYMLAPEIADSGTDPQIKPVLKQLRRLKQETGCAPILTHHMTDNPKLGNVPSSMLGASYLHGWYEAWIGVRQTCKPLGTPTFQVKVDAMRDSMGTREHGLTGLGVGHWSYSAASQGKTDAVGRAAPRMVAAASRTEHARELHAADPSMSYEDIATEVGWKSAKSVQRALKGEPEVDIGADDDD
jgi:hypothetical protein